MNRFGAAMAGALLIFVGASDHAASEEDTAQSSPPAGAVHGAIVDVSVRDTSRQWIEIGEFKLKEGAQAGLTARGAFKQAGQSSTPHVVKVAMKGGLQATVDGPYQFEVQLLPAKTSLLPLGDPGCTISLSLNGHYIVGSEHGDWVNLQPTGIQVYGTATLTPGFYALEAAFACSALNPTTRVEEDDRALRFAESVFTISLRSPADAGLKLLKPADLWIR